MKTESPLRIAGTLAKKASQKGKPAYDAGFRSVGANIIYIAFSVDDLAGAVHGIKALDFCGSAVTMPHKQTILKYLDWVDPDARRIGAVNSIVNDNGRLRGYNVDWVGAKKALEKETRLKGKKAAVAGAGGAARAVCFALKKAGAHVTVYNRTQSKALKLAKDLGVSFGGTLNDLNDATYDVLVNATSLGFQIQRHQSPVSRIRPGTVAMDVVFIPAYTPFLKLAKRNGCTIIPGYKMLMHQAVEQIRLWTGKTPSYAAMEHAFLKANHIRT